MYLKDKEYNNLQQSGFVFFYLPYSQFSIAFSVCCPLYSLAEISIVITTDFKIKALMLTVSKTRHLYIDYEDDFKKHHCSIWIGKCRKFI